MILRRALLILILAGFFLPSVRAAELAGTQFQDSVKIGDQRLVLNGLGLRKKLFIKVYVAGLYLPAKETTGAAVLGGDTVRHLEMEFVRGVSAGQLAGAWSECLEANRPDAGEQLKADFERLNKGMQDVKTGDRIAVTYQPDQGTRVSIRDAAVAEVEGKTFADALFSCWVGDHPPSEDFKAGLLGK
jgi:Chalcone isomerase-like